MLALAAWPSGNTSRVRLTHRQPGVVVGDHRQRRQVLGPRHEMIRQRVAEHVRAVADRDDHVALGCGELGAERRRPGRSRARRTAGCPCSCSGFFRSSIASGAPSSLMTMASSDFTWLMQAASHAGWIGVWSLTLSMNFSALGDHVLARRGERLAAAFDRRLLALHGVGQRAAQHRHGGERRAGDVEVGLELAERIAGLQRVGRDVDHLGVLARLDVARNPRHRAVDHDHHVGLRQELAGVMAEMHRRDRSAGSCRALPTAPPGSRTRPPARRVRRPPPRPVPPTT